MTLGRTELASSYIRKATSDGGSCFINLIVFCELVWVLESVYEYSKQEIAGVLEKMLSIRQFEIETKDIVRQAVHDYRGETGILQTISSEESISHGAVTRQ